MGGFTMIPNELFAQMHDMSGAEFMVTSAIYHLIMSHPEHRENGQRTISISDIEQVAGLSRQGVVNAMKEIEERGFLSKYDNGKGKSATWGVNSVDYCGQKYDATSQLSVPVPVNSVDYPPTKVVNSVDYFSLKEKKKKKEEEKDPPSPLSDSDWQEIIKLSDWWCSFVGRGSPSPANDTAKEKHFRPLALLWARIQETAQCKELLQEKYNAQIKAGYTPSWPSAVVPQIFGDLSARAMTHENGASNGNSSDAWTNALSWLQGGATFSDLPPPVQSAIKESRIDRKKGKIKLGYETDQARKQFIACYQRSAYDEHTC